MTPEELKVTLAEHLKWQRGEGGKRAYLSRANLSRANLSRANLSRANLSGADLSGADLSRANLSGANLSRANLSGADLSGANLSRAYLSGANLSRAYLSGANLSRAYLSGANLSRAYLSGAKGIENAPHFSAPTMAEYIEKWKIQTVGRILILYKGLTLEGKSPSSSTKIEYKDGELVEVTLCNHDVWQECGEGINLSPNAEQAKSWGPLVKEIHVDMADLVCIPFGDGKKIRVKKCRVIGPVCAPGETKGEKT